MTMQHKRGTFFQFDGRDVEVRDFAISKMDASRRGSAIRVHQLGMASKRIADDYAELAGWFCLRIASGREFVVEEGLKNAGVDALVPTRKGDKIMKRHRIIPAPTLPVLPGYVLVRCVASPGAMAGLRRFDKVVDVVGTAEKPYRVPEKFVSKFIQKAAAGKYDHRSPEPIAYAPGDQVMITDGPFHAFRGTVLGHDACHNRVRVEAMLFGRSTPINLDIAQIEKV
jgi:transcriptional antiterminator NusG